MTIGNALFPSVINPKYSTESAGKARMETCLDQYRTNKANNTNGGWLLQRMRQAPEGSSLIKMRSLVSALLLSLAVGVDTALARAPLQQAKLPQHPT